MLVIWDTLTNSLCAYNSHLTTICILLRWQIMFQQGLNFAHGVVICETLWHDWIIRMKYVKIFTIFYWWAHTPFVKWTIGPIKHPHANKLQINITDQLTHICEPADINQHLTTDDVIINFIITSDNRMSLIEHQNITQTISELSPPIPIITMCKRNS